MNERDIFLAGLEISDSAERAAYIDQACAGDAKLKAQVTQLLRTHEETSGFLETPAAAGQSVIDETIATDSQTAGAELSQRPSGETAFRKYLEPSTRPGWLGRLGHYEVEAILGQGAFGIVAKAFDEKLHRVVAIKMLAPELATISPPRKRFLREARSAAAVPHENLVGIHAVEDEPIPYLVMEFIPGDTLQARLDQNGPLDLPDVLRIGQQLAAGMAAAHTANLIHRDIKPSNILLTDGPNERVKISDFGLARAVDDASMTSSGMIAGTPMYMEPEQARGETLDHRADLFSMGSVLYQMASGHPPFRAPNTIAVLKRVCEDTPRPISDVIPGTPVWLCAIIDRLLEKNPADRFQTAQEVSDLLARCQKELELTGKVTCVDELIATQRKHDRHIVQPAPRARLTKSPLLIGGAVAVLGIVAAVVYFNRDTPEPDKSVTKDGSSTISDTQPVADGQPNRPIENWALEFDGTDDYVMSEILNDNSMDMTYEATIFPYFSTPNAVIIGNHRSELRLASNGAPQFFAKSVDDYKEINRGSVTNDKTIPLNKAIHLAGVWQKDSLKLFVDGRQVSSITLENRSVAARIRFSIGAFSSKDQAFHFFHGLIDEVRISKVARYDKDFTPVKRFEPDEHTLALYHFDEGSGDVLKDSSGNGHHGKIVGAKWVRVDDNLKVIDERQLAQPADPYARDRAAAEWVIRAGGTVKVRYDENGKSKIVEKANSIQQLPETPFRLEDIDLAHCQNLINAEASILQGLPNLLSVRLWESNADDHLLKALTSCPRLEMLRIESTPLRSSDLQQFVRQKGLFHVSLQQSQVDDEWAFLERLGQVRHLHLHEADDLGQLPDSSRLGNLFEVNFCFPRSDRIVSEFSRLHPKLRVLTNDKAGLHLVCDGQVVACVEALRSRDVAVIGKDADFTAWTTTERLVLPNPLERKFVGLKLPPNLVLNSEVCGLLANVLAPCYDLNATEFTNADRLAEFIAQTKLGVNVNLTRSDLTDHGLAALHFHKNLNFLEIRNTLVSKTGVIEFKRHVPACTVVSDFGTFRYEHKLPEGWGSEPSQPTANAPMAPDANPYARDRAAAEWVLSVGGAVQVQRKTGKFSFPFNVTAQAELPTEDFALVVANLQEANAFYAASDLRRLADLPSLVQLGISDDGRLGSALLPWILRCQNLTNLDLGKARLQTSELLELGKLPRLNRLTLDGRQVDDRWQFLQKLMQLRYLTISGRSVVAVEELGRFPQLNSIAFHHLAELNAETVDRLQSANKNLRLIWYGNPDHGTRVLGRDPVAAAAKALSAKGWQFQGTLLSGGDWNSQTNKPWESEAAFEITDIQLPADASLTAEELDLLPLLSQQIFTLKATGLHNADRTARAIVACGRVGGLHFNFSDLTDAGLADLATMSQLGSMGLQGTQVTRAGIEACRRKHPTCTIYSDFGTFEYEHKLPEGWGSEPSQPTANAPMAPEANPYARDRAAAEWVLSVGGHVHIRQGVKQTTVSSIDQLPKEPFQLVNAAGMGATGMVRNEDFKRLANLPDLQAVTVSCQSIDAGILPYLATCRRLRLLQGLPATIASSNYSKLSKLPDLTQLGISGESVNDDWHFLKSLPQLRYLVIHGRSVPAMDRIGDHEQLRTVHVSDLTRLDPRAVDRLQAANSRLRVIVGLGNARRVVGSDPVRNTVRKLVARGIRFVGIGDEGAFDLDQTTIEDAAKFFGVEHVTIPSDVSLDADDRLELLSLTQYFSLLSVKGLQHADSFVGSLSRNACVNILDLQDSDLSDAGLAALDRVALVNVHGTQVTRAGIESFKRRVPTCTVQSDFRTFEYEHKLPEGWGSKADSAETP